MERAARWTSDHRDSAVFIGMVLCSVVGGLLGLANVTTPEWYAPIDVALGVVSIVSLRWRRRAPVAIALLTLALSIVSASATGASVVALFSLAVHRQPKAVWMVFALSLLTLPLAVAARPPSDDPLWFSMLVGGLFTAVVTGWGMFVRARRELQASFRERAERVEAEQQLRVDQARQAERTRIAREMHDVLAHRISLLSMHAGALEYRADASPGETQRAVGVIHASAREALEELRGVIGVLRDEDHATTPEPPQPVAADLPALVAESEQAGMRVAFEANGTELAAVPELVGRTAYRVVQEGLTNARKHAPHAAVTVRVHGEAGEGLTVAVANPRAQGTAGPVLPGAGTGLVGLRERAGLAGGALEHGWAEDGTYRVEAWLPWE